MTDTEREIFFYKLIIKIKPKDFKCSVCGSTDEPTLYPVSLRGKIDKDDYFGEDILEYKQQCKGKKSDGTLCQKNYSVLSGTAFEGSHVKVHVILSILRYYQTNYERYLEGLSSRIRPFDDDIAKLFPIDRASLIDKLNGLLSCLPDMSDEHFTIAKNIEKWKRSHLYGRWRFKSFFEYVITKSVNATTKLEELIDNSTDIKEKQTLLEALEYGVRINQFFKEELDKATAQIKTVFDQYDEKKLAEEELPRLRTFDHDEKWIREDRLMKKLLDLLFVYEGIPTKMTVIISTLVKKGWYLFGNNVDFLEGLPFYDFDNFDINAVDNSEDEELRNKFRKIIFREESASNDWFAKELYDTFYNPPVDEKLDLPYRENGSYITKLESDILDHLIEI